MKRRDVKPRCSSAVSLCVISQGFQFWTCQKAEIQAWLRQSVGYFFIYAVICTWLTAPRFSPKNILIILHVFVNPLLACYLKVFVIEWVCVGSVTVDPQQGRWNDRADRVEPAARFTEQIRKVLQQGRYLWNTWQDAGFPASVLFLNIFSDKMSNKALPWTICPSD